MGNIIQDTISSELFHSLSITAINKMHQTYDSYTTGKVAPALPHPTTMFVLGDPYFGIPPSLQLERRWSLAVEGLVVIKAPAYNISHIKFFHHEENVIALADHLKLQHEKLS